MSGNWVPVIGLICISCVLAIYFIVASKNKAVVQRTLRELLDKGHELSPEIVEKIAESKSTKAADLRRGVILISLGAAMMIAGFITGFIEAAFSIAMFPIMTAIGFIILWKIS